MKRLLKLTLALTAACGTLAASSAFADPVSRAALTPGKMPSASNVPASAVAPAAIAPYCANTYTSSVEPITLVKIDGIDSSTSAAVAPGGSASQHEDFTPVTGALRPGQTYTITIKANTDGATFSHGNAVYVDWNGDGDFADAGEGYWIGTITGSSGTDGISVSGPIAVPAGATLGSTRMRVMTAYNTTSLSALPPCRTGTGYGQSEDYTVNVDTNAPLPPPPSLTLAASLSSTTGTVPATTTLTLAIGDGGNTTAQPLTADFSTALPTGVTLGANATTTCPGTFTGASGSSLIKLASGTAIPVGGCSITANLAVNTGGNYTINAGPLSTLGGSLSASVSFFGWAEGTASYSTGFEAPFTVGSIMGQQGWSARTSNVAATAPATGAQHFSQTSAASPASGTNAIAISPSFPAGPARYAAVSANLRISHTTNGASWQFQPQDPDAGFLTTIVLLNRTGNSIDAYTWDPVAGTGTPAPTGATFPTDTYFNLKLLVDRDTSNIRICKDDVQIYESTDGKGTTGGNDVTNMVFQQQIGSGQTSNNTFFADDFKVVYTSSYDCAAPAPVQHTVTPSKTGIGGVSPDTPQTVNDGDTVTFTLSPGGGQHVGTVTGSCGGTLAPSGTSFTTNPVTADCDVKFNFVANVTTYTVTPSVTGSGTISPSTVQTVNSGDTATFTLAAAPGNHIVDVTGSCGGTLTGSSYTTNAVTANCTVVANFAADTTNPNLVCFAPDHPISQSFDGTYVRWEDNTFSDGASIPNSNFNPYGTTAFSFFWPNSAGGNAGVASSTSGGTWLVMQPGDVVGASSIFNTSTTGATAWQAGVDGYLGFRFACSTASACYGYAHMTTTAGSGFPATIVDYCFDSSGASITIGGGAGGPPKVTKSFSPTQVLANANSTATIKLLNTNSSPATLTAALVDTLPSGLVASAATTTCGGTVSFTSGTITLASGATIPAGSCTITATVHSAAEGTYTNTIHAGDLHTDLGNNAEDASADLIVSNTLPFPQPYCPVSFTNDVEPISKVMLSGITNPSDPTVNGSPAHENFLSVAGGALSRGGVYGMAVEGNTAGAYTTKLMVYIDWNQNGTFDTGESFALSDLTNSTGTDGKQSTGDITVPVDALLGPTRMRVIKKYNAAATACNTDGYGQAEDYVVTIDSNPLPQPIADATPYSFSMTAEQDASATDTLTVSNSGPGRLTFNIKRALPEGSSQPSTSRYDVRKLLAGPSANDEAKAGVLLAPLHDDFIGALARDDVKLPTGGNTVLANDPLCVVGTPGLVVHDGNIAPDNGYGWNAIAGTDPKYVDKFTPDSYPATYTTVCMTLLSNTGLTTAPVQVVVFDDDGPGGSPGTELGRVAVTANHITAALAQSFQAVDISEMGLNIADGSVYIGVEWDATAVSGLFVASDESGGTFADGYAYSSATWAPITDTPDFADYKSLLVRAIEESAGEPGVGCDAPSNVAWLSATPASGTINGVGSMDVTVKASAAGLDVGTYQAVLCVNTNDLGHPRFEIPVTFDVTPNVANDTIFKDGFEGAPAVDPDVVTGSINLPVNQDEDGNTFDFVTGQYGVYNPSRVDDINLYYLPSSSTGTGPGLYVYWYGDVNDGVGGVTDNSGEFAVLHTGDVVGPSSNVLASSILMQNWQPTTEGYLGVAFYNEQTSTMNYGYLKLKTTGPAAFPVQVLEYGYNKAGNAITIP